MKNERFISRLHYLFAIFRRRYSAYAIDGIAITIKINLTNPKMKLSSIILWNSSDLTKNNELYLFFVKDFHFHFKKYTIIPILYGDNYNTVSTCLLISPTFLLFFLQKVYIENID